MAVGKGSASRKNRVIRIERPMKAGGLTGAGKASWQTVAEVSAEVIDTLPSRSESLADGINVASRPARIRIRYRSDVTAAMRLLLLCWADGAWSVERTMQIVAGPAIVGNREDLEMMAVDYTSAGNGA